MAAVAVQPIGESTFTPTKAEIVQVETREYVPSSDKAEFESDRAASPIQGTGELADWVKNQEGVPYWARIYPVEYPPFEQQAQGHPEDRRAPHPDQEFPLSQAGPEERARRNKEIEDLVQINEVKRPLDEDFQPNYKYNWALPWFDERYKSQYVKDQHFTPFGHQDVGRRALTHADPETFLKKDGVELHELSPGFGTIVKGLDLTTLTPEEKDEFALFVAQRGVVVFEDQPKFIDQSPEELKQFGYHFSSTQHVHQVSGQPKGHPEFHLVYRSPKWPLDSARRSGRFSNKGTYKTNISSVFSKGMRN